MVETIKRKTKKTVVKEEVVEMKIEISAKLFDHIETAKAAVAEQRGFDVTYGVYIEEVINDLMEMVNQLSEQIEKMANQQKVQSLIPEVVDRSEPVEEVKEEEELSEYDQLMQKFIIADPNDPSVG